MPAYDRLDLTRRLKG